ncbi:protein mono-ADP-ribosyltransferase TIPARP-like [Latimeria chalumnae]|uniref:protein mono-ADP-ribosyltransferase TIPARP-like n=1 Tax=Latimeria chalumnae TaxID=7897 RepID=UPI00313BDFA3
MIADNPYLEAHGNKRYLHSSECQGSPPNKKLYSACQGGNTHESLALNQHDSEKIMDQVFDLIPDEIAHQIFALWFRTQQADDIEICDNFLLGSCASGIECHRHHTKYPYHWQDINSELEVAFQVGKRTHHFRINGQNYTVFFKRAIQKNKSTGFTRKIRRRPAFRSTSSMQLHLKTVSNCSNTITGQPLPALTHLQADNYLPTWEPQYHEDFTKTLVEPLEQDFFWVHQRFHETLPENKFLIQEIFRVHNRNYWDKYMIHKKYMSLQLAKDGESYNEAFLFHGTRRNAVDPICKHNFDPRIAGKNGTMYGHGSYFARDSEYSHGFTLQGKNSDCYMFLAKVLVGRSTVGKPSFRRPPLLHKNTCSGLYDSCVNNSSDPSIYVIFDKCQMYPYFLIRYMEVKGVVYAPELHH